MHFVTQYSLGMLQVNGNDLIQTRGAKDVKIILPVSQVHGRKQAHQSKIMIAVQVANKNVFKAV